MAGLISSLHNSSGALRVHSKGLEVTGKNLANVNNRGYAKQRVEIGDRGQINTGIATESMGVEAMGLRQNRDALLDKSVMRELTSTADLEAAKKVLQNAETALGQFLDRTKDSTSIQNAGGASGGGISDALTDFFNAWESFSVKPNDVGEKQLLIAKAQILAEKISKTDERLAGVQSDVDSQVAVDVDIVNQILDEIAEINTYIAKAELTKPYSAVDLRDKRQAKLEELSKYADVKFKNFNEDPKQNLGRIIVELDGVVLVNGETVDRRLAYDSDTKVLSAGGSAFDLNTMPAGKIGAQIRAAYDTVTETRNDIKTLAEKISSEVNSVYQNNGGVGSVFNYSTSSSGLLQLSYNSNLKIAAGVSGGNAIALSVAELGTKIYDSSGATFESPTPHGFSNGDKVYSTQQGLMWIAAGIDPKNFQITENTKYYVVEKISNTGFNLKTNDDPAVYLDQATASSPITTVTKYQEISAESTLSTNLVQYITQFSFPDASFVNGDKIQFSSLPTGTPDSLLDRKLTYTLKETSTGSGKFEILKPDGTLLQITEDELKGVDRTFNPAVQKLSDSTSASFQISAMTFGNPPSFYGDFQIDNSLKNGDKVKFQNIPLNSTLNINSIYTLDVVYVNPGGDLTNSEDPNAIKAFQIKDINGKNVSGIDINDIDSNTRVALLDQPSGPSVSTVKSDAFADTQGQFYGEFVLSTPAGFAVGQNVSISKLPQGSVFSENGEYRISSISNFNGKSYVTLTGSDGASITTRVSDVTPNQTAISFEEVVIEGGMVSFNGTIDGSFSSYFNSIVTEVAQELNTTNNRLEDQKLSEEMAVNSRDQYSGVSQDEEITDMMKFQRSFQASARHINVIDTLLEQVVNRLGVG
jgi:flagellar hook-associated protein 1 FlgK